MLKIVTICSKVAVMLLCTVLIMSNGCSLIKPQKSVTNIEIEKTPFELQEELDKAIATRFDKWANIDTSKVIESIIVELEKQLPFLDIVKNKFNVNEPTRIQLLKAREFIILGGLSNKIYLSQAFFNVVKYENEAAFFLARELVIMHSGVLRDKAHNDSEKNAMRRVVSFGKDSFYDLGRVESLRADSNAVKLMYAAGYDPRGAVTALQTLISLKSDRNLLNNIWSNPSERLELVRQEIAKLSPLRDPVISSAKFKALMNYYNK